jgi:hypothetical protein
MCLFAVLAGLFPRIAFAIDWIDRPAVVDSANGDRDRIPGMSYSGGQP